MGDLLEDAERLPLELLVDRPLRGFIDLSQELLERSGCEPHCLRHLPCGFFDIPENCWRVFVCSQCGVVGAWAVGCQSRDSGRAPRMAERALGLAVLEAHSITPRRPLFAGSSCWPDSCVLERQPSADFRAVLTQMLAEPPTFSTSNSCLLLSRTSPPRQLWQARRFWL